jgi:hypothetical protein
MTRKFRDLGQVQEYALVRNIKTTDRGDVIKVLYIQCLPALTL